MSTKNIAVVGEVVATAGEIPFTGATSGEWTAGAVSYQSYQNLSITDVPVIYQAECTFSFRGESSVGSLVT